MDTEIVKPLIIIPAAGFGTRVGAPMAKEMLVRGSGQPMIQFALNIAKTFDWPTHVLTRKEKVNLIEYLGHVQSNDIQLVEPTIEWPATILQAKDYLHDWNFLILPDTRFTPIEILKVMWDNRKKSLLHYACFTVNDPEHWGIISQIEGNCFISEKCNSQKDERLPQESLAWGVILFHKDAFSVFHLHLQSTLERIPKKISYPISIYQLDSFVDLGRN